MKKPELPNTEEKRLETLKALNILDTLPEERFDRVTRMAKRLFNVPIALVSLVDENRQWFKSSDGLAASETPRDISFCGHAILGDSTFYIKDALEDTRFTDNPLVTGDPNIRFYAGHPLTAANGEKIGTLCIIDKKPKKLTEEDLTALSDLAYTVEQELCAIQLSTMDELTNLSNRRGFTLVANHYLNFNKKQNMPATLVYFDLNNFKQINDVHGHSEGDNALQLFASVMKSSFRNFDLLARIGGDEFIALLFNSDLNAADEMIEKLSNNLKSVVSSQELEYEVGFSYGLIECNSLLPSSIESYIQQADNKMYECKHEQKNLHPLEPKLSDEDDG